MDTMNQELSVLARTKSSSDAYFRVNRSLIPRLRASYTLGSVSCRPAERTLGRERERAVRKQISQNGVRKDRLAYFVASLCPDRPILGFPPTSESSSKPVPTSNILVQVCYRNQATASHYMSTGCAKKLAPTFTVTSSKPSIPGVTNSGATLHGTPSKWFDELRFDRSRHVHRYV